MEDARLFAVEPNISELPKRLRGFENIELTTVDEALQQADTVLLLVDHKEFKDIPREHLLGKSVIDTKGLWQ